MQTEGRQRGYALLMTLMLLALAVAATTGAATACLRHATQAANVQRDLQRRWGMLSCKIALLPEADALLQKKRVNASFRTSVVLGGQQFDLTVSDEQAKLNVNTLLVSAGRQNAEQIATSLLRAGGSSAALVLPDTAQPSEDGEPAQRGKAAKNAIIAMDQIAPGASPAALLGSTDRNGVVASLTCWGDGRIHFKRASREVLKAACSPALDLQFVESLYQAARKNPQMQLNEAIAGLEPSDAQRTAAELLLTDKSNCHSLWVVVQDGDRTWHRLYVSDGSGTEQTFDW